MTARSSVCAMHERPSGRTSHNVALPGIRVIVRAAPPGVTASSARNSGRSSAAVYQISSPLQARPWMLRYSSESGVTAPARSMIATRPTSDPGAGTGRTPRAGRRARPARSPDRCSRRRPARPARADGKLQPVAAVYTTHDREVRAVGRPVGELHVLDQLARGAAGHRHARERAVGNDPAACGPSASAARPIAKLPGCSRLAIERVRFGAVEAPVYTRQRSAVPQRAVEDGLAVGRDARRSDEPAPERQPPERRRTADRPPPEPTPPASPAARVPATKRRRAAPCGATRPGRGPPTGDSQSRSSSTATSSARPRSWAEWKRSSGRFSRHRLTTRATAGVTPGGRSGGIVLEDRGQRFRDACRAERPGARQHLVHHDAEREDVGAMIDGSPAPVPAPCSRPCRRRRRRPSTLAVIVVAASVSAGVDQFRDAEVQDLHPAVAGEEQVLGLQIAMDDAAGVSSRESARDLRACTRSPAASGRAPFADGRAGSRPRATPRRCRRRRPRVRRRRRPAGWDGRGRRRPWPPSRSAGRDRVSACAATVLTATWRPRRVVSAGDLPHPPAPISLSISYGPSRVPAASESLIGHHSRAKGGAGRADAITAGGDTCPAA